MNKFFTKIATLSVGLLMAIGVGVAVDNKETVKSVEAADGSVSKSAATLADENGWTQSAGSSIGTKFSSFSLDDYITVSFTGTGNTATYWTDVRVYGTKNKSDATISFTGASGVTIKTITLSYTVQNSPSFTPAITSGTALTVNSSSQTITMKGGSKNPQIRITNFACTYTYTPASTPVTNIALSGTDVDTSSAPAYSIDIHSSDNTAHTINVGLTPTDATDQKVNIASTGGTSGLVTRSTSQLTCSSGSGSFTITSKGNPGYEVLTLSGNTETSVQAYLTVTVIDDTKTYYSVSYTGLYGSLSNTSSVEKGEPLDTYLVPDTHYHLPDTIAITAGGNPLVVDTEYSYNSSTGEIIVLEVNGDIVVSTSCIENTKYTVTYNANGGSVSPASESIYAGEHPTLPTPTKTNYSFDGWQVDGVGEYVTPSYSVESDVTLVAHWSQVTLVTDLLTRADTGVTSGATNYSNWSDVTKTSYAVYAGNSAGGNDSIQIRSKNSNSGIVSTTSGGKVKSITVVFEGDTSSGRTVNVYGKNTAYESPVDLFGDASGDLLGSIVNGTSTSLTVSGNYTYVGLRSADGAIYLTSVSIVWEGSAAPTTTYTVTYDANGGTGSMTDPSSPYDSGSTVTTLTNEFTRDGYVFKNWNTSSDGTGTDYDEGAEFVISENTTLYAVWEEEGGGGTTVATRCYHLVTSDEELVAGAKYIIAATAISSHAMSTTQNTNNRGEEEITISESIASITSDGVQVVTLSGSAGAWNLAVSGGYLYAASSKSNHLKTETEIDSDGNANWAITITDGVASIVAQGNNTRNVMQYNSSSSLFACYSSASQTNVSLYRLDFGETLLANVDCGTGTGSHTMPEGYTWNTNLKGVYDDLPASEKTTLASASSLGLDRYDYIVGKYNPTGETDPSKTNYVHFITGRSVTPRSSSGIVLLSVLGKNTTNTSIIVIVTVGIAAIAIGGYFLLRKKKED